MIELEHTHILGETVEEIAWNKSGIFKVSTSNIYFLSSNMYSFVMLNVIFSSPVFQQLLVEINNAKLWTYS